MSESMRHRFISCWLAPALFGAALLFVSSARAEAEDPAFAIFDRAQAAFEGKDPAALDKARIEIEALLKSQQGSSAAHYTHGWILSHLDQPEAALPEYEEALRLEPDHAQAAYNAGVILMNLGREPEAIAHFEKAVAIDPKLEDGHYNLGQAYYNRKDFAKALAAWRRTLELAPNDFQAAKKVLQAYHGLGDREGAARARLKAIELWKNSADPALRQQKDFVFDQFDASGWHVYASEVFEHPEDSGFLYRFRVSDKDGNVVGSVRLEPGIVELEKFAFIIGMERGGTMWTPGPAFETLPDYDALKSIVLEKIAKEFPH